MGSFFDTIIYVDYRYHAFTYILDQHWFAPILDQYVGKCMVSKNPPGWYQNSNTSQIVVLGGYH